MRFTGVLKEVEYTAYQLNRRATLLKTVSLNNTSL